MKLVGVSGIYVLSHDESLLFGLERRVRPAWSRYIFALVVAFPAHDIPMLVAGLGAGVVCAVVCEVHVWMGD